MKYIVLLSGSFTEMAMEEFRAVVEKQKASMEVLHKHSDRFFIADISKTISFSDLALTQEVSILLGDVDSYDSIDWKRHIKGTSAVRSRKIPGSYIYDSSILEKKIGAHLHESGISINLDKPQDIITAYLSPDAHLLGKQVFSSADNNFHSRRPDLRPFSKPISLDPKIARAMVNLARASAGDSIADPFVGTGGILIEAGLIRCRVHGMDIDSGMVDGTIKNLDHFKIEPYRIKVGDAFDLRSMFGDTFDAIVTDFPYSKNTKKIDSRNLAQKYIEYLPSVLNPQRYACVASNHGDLETPSTLQLIFRYELVLHKTLSKFIYVLRKTF